MNHSEHIKKKVLVVPTKKHKDTPQYTNEGLNLKTTRRWIVNVPKPVPHYNFVKGTKLINKSASYVSQKIDNYLRLSSIDANFDSENSEATCKTSDYIYFNIFLYAGPVANSTYVEMMRIKGCGFSFVKERDNIMNVAKGGEIPKQQHSTIFGSIGDKPPSLLETYVPPSQSDLESTLLRASDKLHSNISDMTVLFILQTLVALTTSDKFVPENAHQMSVLIMENKYDIRDRILSIHMAQVSSRMDNDEVSEQICNASLTVLTNGILAMYSSTNEKQGEYFLEQEEQSEDQQFKSFIAMFIPSVVEAVVNHETWTNNACLAMKCLEAMVFHSTATCEILREMDNDVGTLVEQAKLYGYREHLKLEQAAVAAMEALCQSEVVTLGNYG